jgi:transposase
MAPDKKNAERLGAHLVFIDESGFLLIPHVRKTWAPRGQTPIHRHRYCRDKVSAIAALTVSPRRGRLGLYFGFHDENYRQLDVADFLHELLRHLRGFVIVMWDNATIHRGEPIKTVCRRYPRLWLEAFPPYAPELNPAEGVWIHAKREMANGSPVDTLDILEELVRVLGDLGGSQPLLRGCIHQSDLPFF